MPEPPLLPSLSTFRLIMAIFVNSCRYQRSTTAVSVGNEFFWLVAFNEELSSQLLLFSFLPSDWELTEICDVQWLQSAMLTWRQPNLVISWRVKTAQRRCVVMPQLQYHNCPPYIIGWPILCSFAKAASGFLRVFSMCIIHGGFDLY